jgi:phosphoribosyl 1,2-cyclic phosphodiesterase
MRFSVLASGSAGNALYLETDQVRVLVDAGLSCREIVKRLDILGVPAESLDALIITHEHIDHTRGAGPLARRFDLPVYMNHRTFRKACRIMGSLCRPVMVQTGQTLTLRDLCVETFTKCHDAADPLGLVFSTDHVRMGLVTDLGRSTRLVEDRLRGCHALIVEFNYDPEMLETGPYPLDLKRRIGGTEGHLSNQQGGDMLGSVSHEDLSLVVLAHLSEVNNVPERAYEIAAEVLEHRGLSATRILVSRQDEPVPMMEL